MLLERDRKRVGALSRDHSCSVTPWTVGGRSGLFIFIWWTLTKASLPPHRRVGFVWVRGARPGPSRRRYGHPERQNHPTTAISLGLAIVDWQVAYI